MTNKEKLSDAVQWYKNFRHIIIEAFGTLGCMHIDTLIQAAEAHLSGRYGTSPMKVAELNAHNDENAKRLSEGRQPLPFYPTTEATLAQGDKIRGLEADVRLRDERIVTLQERLNSHSDSAVSGTKVLTPTTTEARREMIEWLDFGINHETLINTKGGKNMMLKIKSALSCDGVVLKEEQVKTVKSALKLAKAIAPTKYHRDEYNQALSILTNALEGGG